MKVTLMKKIIAVVFIACLISAAIPVAARGEPRYTIVGDDNGLEIHVPKKTQDTGNLNPGDRKHSSLRLKNGGSHQLHVYMRTNILEEKAPNGGYLKDVMTLVIKEGNRIISDGTFKASAEKGNVYLGIMAPGAQKTLDFIADLPTDIGNDYQASYMKVNWIFTTQTDGEYEGGDDDDDEDDRDDDDDEDRDYDEGGDSEVEIQDEDIPQGPGETPSEPGIEITVDDEDIPVGPAEMPKTGERSPLFYYGAGALILTLGMALRKK